MAENTNRLWLWSLVGLVLLGAVVGFYVWLMTPPPGRLVVRTVPNGVSVRVDGDLKGVTVDTGLVVTFLETATHFLELEKVGYVVDTTTVYVALDEVLELQMVMKPPGMVFILGRTFKMGDDGGAYNEKPVHRVTLSPFYMDRTEVTVEAFRKFRRAYAPPFSGDTMPAVEVTWEDAQAYCRWAGKRLPTEAEWERACRGTQGSPYSFGNRFDPQRARIGFAMEAGPGKVGAFKPGNGGLYDMTGNVWEWCADWYGRDTYRSGRGENPGGPKTGSHRVLRGGAWYSKPQYAKCTHRPGNIQKTKDVSFGFRCVKEVE
ncbi:MAG: SUMF1/EgtB/PvdO family nonheme iron enzyme [bacterium]|nr:SUMF1/EgtB/PvdO family nonheme iron enzyme [bacterium]